MTATSTGSTSASSAASGSRGAGTPTTLDAGVQRPNITAESLTTEGMKFTNLACRADDPGPMGAVALAAPMGRAEMLRNCLRGGGTARLWWSFRDGKITEVNVTGIDAGPGSVGCVVLLSIGTKARLFDGDGACVATVVLADE